MEWPLSSLGQLISLNIGSSSKFSVVVSPTEDRVGGGRQQLLTITTFDDLRVALFKVGFFPNTGGFLPMFGFLTLVFPVGVLLFSVSELKKSGLGLEPRSTLSMNARTFIPRGFGRVAGRCLAVAVEDMVDQE